MDKRDGSEPVYFLYGQEEIEYLKSRDKRLAAAIDRIGPIRRQTRPDLFSALVNSIVGQQISTKAQVTIFARMEERFSVISPELFTRLSVEEIQSCGISMRKAGYIRDAAVRIHDGELDLQELHDLSDDEVCVKLSGLKGVGVWTAEMLMLFSMGRKNILSYDDLAIQRGLRMLYRKRSISREQFEVYRRRYTPYASVASLYLWAIAGGEYEEYSDPAVPGGKRKKVSAETKGKG